MWSGANSMILSDLEARNISKSRTSKNIASVRCYNFRYHIEAEGLVKVTGSYGCTLETVEYSLQMLLQITNAN